MRMRCVHRILVRKPDGKRPLGRPRRRWEDNIKMDLQELGGSCGDWMELAQDRDRWRALVGTVRNLRVPKMQGISWLAAEPVGFSRRTLFHGVRKYVLFNDLLFEWDVWKQKILICMEARSGEFNQFHFSRDINFNLLLSLNTQKFLSIYCLPLWIHFHIFSISKFHHLNAKGNLYIVTSRRQYIVTHNSEWQSQKTERRKCAYTAKR